MTTTVLTLLFGEERIAAVEAHLAKLYKPLVDMVAKSMELKEQIYTLETELQSLRTRSRRACCALELAVKEAAVFGIATV